MRQRGTGHVYPHGKTWWAQYFVNGRRVRESTGVPRTAPKDHAKTWLKVRLGRAAEGRPVLPGLDRIPYDDLAADLRRHYKTTGARTLGEAEKRLKPLDAFFRGRRAAEIGSDDLTRYVEQRQSAGLSNATINRELSILGTMFRHAAAQDPPKVLRVPVIRMLKEAPPRAGFFEPARYEAVRRRLRPDLRVACDLAYTYGWRVRDEVLTLERRQVNLEAATVRLEPGTTKNRDGREIFLTPALKAVLAEQLERVAGLGRKLGRIIPFVFPHFTDGPIHPKTGERRYKVGDRIRDFRKAWATACKRAGCPGMLRHDFRRTAVRNMVNDGTPEKVAMQITGHKTRSVFDRYHIVAPEDLRAAAARIASRQAEKWNSQRRGGRARRPPLRHPVACRSRPSLTWVADNRHLRRVLINQWGWAITNRRAVPHLEAPRLELDTLANHRRHGLLRAHAVLPGGI